MRYRFFLSLVVAVGMTATAYSQQFTLKGEIAGMTDSLRVVVADDENPDGKSLASGSFASGSFMLSGTSKLPRLARLSFFSKNEKKQRWVKKAELRLMVDTTEIQVSADKTTLFSDMSGKKKEPLTSIRAGYANLLYQHYLAYMRDMDLLADSLSYAEAKAWFDNGGDESKYTDLIKANEDAKKRQRQMMLDFIDSNPLSPVATALVARQVYSPFSYSVSQVDKWMKSFENNPDTIHVNFLRRNIVQIKAQATGTPFTDFIAKTPEGKDAMLSTYMKKGKLTLIDFWASWCGPCRAAIPKVKKILDANNDRLVVISCSVDEKEAAWHKAVEAEKMPWAQLLIPKDTLAKTVSQAYMISSIPRLVLIDSEGRIVMTTHKPEYIQQAIKSL
ncbi:MAG: thioredoxin-like domain-containing protein [Prevotella sp.]